ncbi:glutaredoxin family protein [Aerococcaceae bacterium WGS1372]
MSEIEIFNQLVNDFEEINAEEAEDKLQSVQGTVVFLGRPTCPFCRKFAPKLHEVSKNAEVDVYYVNSEKEGQEVALSEFREKYGLATVPSLLVSAEDNVKVRSDSSMSTEEITSFIKV